MGDHWATRHIGGKCLSLLMGQSGTMWKFITIVPMHPFFKVGEQVDD